MKEDAYIEDRLYPPDVEIPGDLRRLFMLSPSGRRYRRARKRCMRATMWRVWEDSKRGVERAQRRLMMWPLEGMSWGEIQSRLEPVSG